MKGLRRLALALVVVVAVLAASGCQSVARGVVDGRLAPCPGSPNCANSEDPAKVFRVEPLAFSGDPQAAFRTLVAFLEAEPRVDLVLVEDDYAHAVFRTALLRFRDDVEFRLDAASSVIQVRSASRLGFSDLGANRRRIESLRERWNPSTETPVTRDG